jgi:hypothetical protein
VKQPNSGSDFDELILKELNEHLKALISLCMENKRDLDYVKFNLDYIKFKLEEIENKSKETNLIHFKEASKNLINIKNNWKWPHNPGFDILSDSDK